MGTNLGHKSKDDDQSHPGKERRPVIMSATQLDAPVGILRAANGSSITEYLIPDARTGLVSKVHRSGRGTPLFILNGLLGLNKHWHPCLSRFAEVSDCMLVEPPLLELAGDQCSVSGVVRIVTELIERLADGPAVLAGNSLGGHVAMRIALGRPELVRGIVLIGSSGLFERTFEKNVMHSPSREWLENKIGDLFCDRANVPPGMVDEAYAELRHRKGARALVKLGRSAKNDHVGEEIPHLRTPTLLVWGRQDNVTPPEVAEEFRSLIPGSRLEWIDRCGHAPQIERPDDVVRHVCGFMTSAAIAGVARA